MAELLPGLQAALGNRYTIERELGRGGMALVFLAHDLKHERPVALKVLRPDLAAAVGSERFLREIQIAARLAHPHILPLHDSGTAGGFVYYVMPYVEGESLRDRLTRERQLPLAEALQITREVADALSYAHSHDVVHRDIKPENILLTGGHALVADFGIARAITAAGEERLTGTGIAVGTPAYMSPEQATSGPVDGRSDIYSLGCVLYEMLGGEPPFTGPSAQAILARHSMDPVPPLRTLRQTAPEAVEQTIAKALAKAPADRFSTAAQFVAALTADSGLPHPRARLLSRRRGAAVLAAGLSVLALAAALWRLVLAPPARLNPRNVIVYPLLVSSEGVRDTALAENVGDALREALNSTAYLKGIDGWPLLDEQQRNDLRSFYAKAARAIARQQHAGFCVVGRILLGDSVRVFLELHNLIEDSSFTRALVFGERLGAWSLGVRAAGELLPLLIPPGRAVDLSPLTSRSPAATASFLQAEGAYRRGRFEEALEHYRNAVRADPAFALAALKGAQVASWNLRVPEATELIRVAIAHEGLLSPPYAHFARGFEAYLTFQADSAVRHFGLALELDPEWPDAWMGLGEVYTHLLPRDSPLDSLAEAAFGEVHRLDPNFVPVLYHLIEIALRKGDVQNAAQLMRQFRRGQPDSVELVATDLMLECVQQGPGAVDWRTATLRSPRIVTEAARSLAVGGLHQPACARAAWHAILAYDTTSPPSRISFRWGALQGLQGLLLAEGRYREVTTLLGADTVFDAELHGRLYILDALAGADAAIDSLASAAGVRLRDAYEADPRQMKSETLWHLGIWEAARGRAGAARAVGDALAARAARSGDREESLMAQSVTARAALAGGDSAQALKLLQALVPTTGRGALQWNPWESLGGERLLLAELRLARGEFAEAISVAANFDAPAPVPYILYLRSSLSLRLRAAREPQYERLARRSRARLAALGRGDLVGDGP